MRNTQRVLSMIAALATVLGVPSAHTADCQTIGENGFRDLNCDGSADAADTLPLLEYIAGLTPDQPQDCTPVGQPLIS